MNNIRLKRTRRSNNRYMNPIIKVYFSCMDSGYIIIDVDILLSKKREKKSCIHYFNGPDSNTTTG